MRPEQDAHAHAVERKPGAGEEDGDGGEHAYDADLAAVDVALGLAAPDAGDVPLPDPQSDQRVEDGEEAERDQVAREEHHPQEEALFGGGARVVWGAGRHLGTNGRG